MDYLLLGALMIGGPAVYALLGVFVSRKLLHGRVQEGHNDVCVPIFLNAGVLFAVLAFVAYKYMGDHGLELRYYSMLFVAADRPRPVIAWPPTSAGSPGKT